MIEGWVDRGLGDLEAGMIEVLVIDILSYYK